MDIAVVLSPLRIVMKLHESCFPAKYFMNTMLSNKVNYPSCYSLCDKYNEWTYMLSLVSQLKITNIVITCLEIQDREHFFRACELKGHIYRRLEMVMSKFLGKDLSFNEVIHLAFSLNGDES